MPIIPRKIEKLAIRGARSQRRWVEKIIGETWRREAVELKVKMVERLSNVPDMAVNHMFT